MRSKNTGIISGIYESFTESENLEMFEKICKIRYFELNAAKANISGLMKMPVYLSLGQESIPAAISTILKDPLIFAQHRAHGYYIAFGGNLESLIDELLHRKTGCAKGMGGSASIHSLEKGMYGHDGLMGSQVPIAVGMALGINHTNKKVYDSLGKNITKKKILAVMGDASAEEDYVIGGAIPWAARHKLPILFICEDNNLSILTEVKVRRNWKTSDVARAYGMNAVEMPDNPWLIMDYLKKLKYDLPAFMNIYTVRAIRHQGGKRDGGKLEWNRFKLTKRELCKIGLEKKMKEIENETREKINKLWESKLKE